jgi:hypothetical protein
MTKHFAMLLMAAGSVGLLTGCNPKDGAVGPQRPIVGSGLSFTSSPDGGALSVLYDTATIEIPGKATAVQGGSKSQTRAFRMVLGQVPQTLRVHVRGARFAAKPEVLGLTFKVGEREIDLTPQPGEDNFVECFEYAASTRTLDVAWTGTVKQVAGEDVRLDLDSIDIAALSGGSPKDPACLPAGK